VNPKKAEVLETYDRSARVHDAALRRAWSLQLPPDEAKGEGGGG